MELSCRSSDVEQIQESIAKVYEKSGKGVVSSQQMLDKINPNLLKRIIRQKGAR